MNRQQSTSKRARAGSRLAWIGLGSVLALYGFARLRSDPPALVARTAPSTEFSGERALDHLVRIEGDGRPHPVGSAAAARVRADLVAQFTELGLATEVQERLAVGHNGVIALVRNVIAKMPGREHGPALMLAAHYDSVSAGPGSSDDGVGTAAILEIARALTTSPQLKNDVVFLVDEGEEAGLIGARAFVDAHPLATEIAVVVNLEARGTCGRAHMFETSADNGWLVNAYAESVPHPSAVSVAYELYKRMPNNTDFTVFKERGMAGLNFAYIGGVARYHTPLDDVAHLDPRSLQHMGESALAVVRALGELDLKEPARGDAVYADVFGFTLLHWPAHWCVWLAIAAAVFVAFALRSFDKGALLFGFVGAFAGLVATALSAHLIALFVVFVRGDDAPWSAHPWPMRMAVLAGSCAIGLASARCVLSRASQLREARIAAHVVIALCAVAAAIWLPSASYIVLVPALVAGVASVLERKRSSGTFAFLAPLIVAAVFLAPLIVGLEEAFEFRMGAALGAPVGLLVLLLAPAFASARARSLTVLNGCAAIALVVALIVPAHDERSPAVLNFAHVHTARTGSAEWFAIPFGMSLPKSVVEAGPFAEDAQVASAWWTRATLSHRASAEPATAAPPRLDFTSESRSGEKRIVKAHLVSPRGALRFAVKIPNGCELRAVERAGVRLVASLTNGGVARFTGIDADGVDLEIALPSVEPVEIDLIDASAELPASAARILGSRPRSFAPRGEGDVSVIVERVRL